MIGKTDGNNFVGLYYNDRNEICTKVSGQLNFQKTLSDLEKEIEISGIHDYGIMNNSGVIILSKLGEASFEVTIVSNKEDSSVRNFSVKETLFVHFHYPVVFLVKGGNEILMYSIPENMYYYTKLYSPIVFRSSLAIAEYDIRLRVFIDLGDYLAFAEYSFYLGSTANSGTVNKRYIEKSTFPNSQLLAGFDMMQIKFKSKDEDAFTLQFKNAVLSVGILTYGLISVSEMSLKRGELLCIAYEGFFTWKKNK